MATKSPVGGRLATQPTNGAKPDIDSRVPYLATIEVRGVVPLLFHSWNVEAVAAKGSAAKGSKEKKSDNIESYVYRTPDGRIGIPGINMHATLAEAARWMQDPRSPRKSLRDLIKAAIHPMDVIAPMIPDQTTWDFEDHRRVTIQRSAITRTRPALREGWRVSFALMVTTPEYVTPGLLHQLASSAGRLVGLCDFRPTYGRFEVSNFETGEAA